MDWPKQARTADWESGVLRLDREKQFEVSELTMEIMERLATWYGIEVFYASEGAKQVRFSGILDRNDSIKHCLKRMEDTGTIHFSVNERSVTVYKN